MQLLHIKKVKIKNSHRDVILTEFIFLASFFFKILLIINYVGEGGEENTYLKVGGRV